MMNETARLTRDNDRLAQQLGDMIEAYDKQGEELRELRAKYEVLNDFERSQCHKLLGELTRAGREIERLRRLLDGAKDDCDKLLAAGKVLEGEVAALTAERDEWKRQAEAAKKDLKTYPLCGTCRYYRQIGRGHWTCDGPNCEDCMDDDDRPAWEWRGPQEAP